jgi:hypothetical protein
MWYLVSVGSLLCGIFLGLLVVAYDISPQEGLVADHIWPTRIALAVWSTIGLAIAWHLAKRPPRSTWAWPREAPIEVQHFAAHSITKLAFSDAIWVYGLLLFLYSGQPLDLFLFGAAGALAIAWHFPWKSEWDQQPNTDEEVGGRL